MDVLTPSSRNSNFEFHLIKKGQRHITRVDDQILSLYAKGMSTLDIVANFDEMYGAEIPPGHISQVNYAMIGDGASD